MNTINPNLNKHHLALELDKVLLRLEKFAISSLAKEKCLNIEILNDKNQIEYELNLVSEAKKIIDNNTNSPIPLVEINSISNLFKYNNFTIEELFILVNVLKTSREVRNYILKNNNSPFLYEIVNNFYIDKDLEDKILNSFNSNFELKDDVTPTLKGLKVALKQNKENLKENINSLLQNPSFVQNLQETIVTMRENRPVFQVKASCKNKVQGIVHDVSATNLTYFIEPNQLIPLNNKIKKIEIDIQNEINRILKEFSSYFIEIKNDLLKNQNLLTNIDFIFAKAKYSIHTKSTPATLINDKFIDIQAMRHPLLIDMVENIVENDFTLGKTYNSLLITGSNTGGKTVCLKSVGLMILMTKAGLHIPCLGAKLYPYNKIFCDISTEQNIEQGYSTFSAHIKNISEIIEQADNNSIILLDELGSGTDPVESSCLSRAILENLKDRNIQNVITTHLGELKSLKYLDDYFENATVLFDTNSLEPLYKLVVGLSGTSNAIDISKRIGLNSEIISKARDYLKQTNNPNSKIFNEIEKTNLNLIKKENKADDALKNAKEFENEYETKLSELNKNKKKSLDNFKRKFQNELEIARNEIKGVMDEIRKEKSTKIALRAYNKLNKIETQIRDEFSKNDDELAQRYQAISISDLKIGKNVLIKRLNQVVIVDSLPDKKGFVTVRIGNIKSKVKIDDLAYTDKKVAQHLKKINVSFAQDDNLLSRLDVRGMRAYDAIEYIDEKLDKANLRGLNQLTIIHGFGTGALKQAIADYLKTSPYVAKYRYGNENEGREGVVIVDLV